MWASVFDWHLLHTHEVTLVMYRCRSSEFYFVTSSEFCAVIWIAFPSFIRLADRV